VSFGLASAERAEKNKGDHEDTKTRSTHEAERLAAGIRRPLANRKSAAITNALVEHPFVLRRSLDSQPAQRASRFSFASLARSAVKNVVFFVTFVILRDLRGPG
jgi:hypothetical protein